MDPTGIALFTLVCLTGLLGIGALIGILASAWYILLPMVLLAVTLIFAGSDMLAQAVVAALILGGVMWAEYRVWRG